jgi:2-oxoisovalerate dehydrogenase E1 component
VPLDVPARSATSLTTSDLLALYSQMLRIRLFEERAAVLYQQGEVPGFVHLSIGQEAIAAGACWALEADDVITSTHRGHGHVLAKGLSASAAFAELFGKRDGSCHGRGGSMHIADPALGIFGANGIVGAGVPIATGAATAAKLRGDGRVVVSFFGDGALSTGAFHEGATLAGSWQLPLVLLCENNQYSEFSSPRGSPPVSIERRAAAYDFDFVRVDGNDVQDVATAMTDVVAALRGGGRPVFVEGATFRVRGHYEGDPQKYRDAQFDQLWLARDPVAGARAALLERGCTEDELNQRHHAAIVEIDAAVEAARRGDFPDPSSLSDYVGPAASGPSSDTALPDDAAPIRMSAAIRAALRRELEVDPRVFLAGIDVGSSGNVFGLTRGLAADFPNRVRDTPIAEAAIVGMGVGAAMAGMRPIVEIMYFDFIGVCMDQIVNQAAKIRFMTGGRVDVPLTIRTQFGAGRSSGAQHSQSLEAMLAHVPGLAVVMPSTPADAYGLLRAAVHHDGPVVVVEHRLLYETSGPGFSPDHMVPIGKANVVRTGTDVTVVSYSRMARESLVAADRLASEGIDVEVVDLRSIAPLDWDAVMASFAKTNRLVIAHEAAVDFGVGAEIAARIADGGFWHMDAPVLRVGAPFTPAPYSPPLEAAWVPGAADVADAVRRIMAL